MLVPPGERSWAPLDTTTNSPGSRLALPTGHERGEGQALALN